MVLKICPNDKVLNPLSNRCVLKTGKIGKKILNNSNQKPKQSSVPIEKPKKSLVQKEKPKKSLVQKEKPKKSLVPKEKPKKSSVPIEKPKKSSVPIEKPKKSLVPIEKPKKSLVPKEKPKKSLVPKEKPKQSTDVTELKKLNIELYKNAKKIKKTNQLTGFIFFGSLNINKISKYYRTYDNIEQLYIDNKRIHLLDETKNIVFSISEFDNTTLECEVMTYNYYDNEFIYIFKSS